jgi:glycosyltransferase involved in cell wall biosynthesis
MATRPGFEGANVAVHIVALVKVAHVIDRINVVGGVQTYLGALLPGLAGHGVDSVLIAGDASGSFGDFEAVRAAAPLHDGPRLPAGQRAELDRVLRAIKPDVVVSHIATSPGVGREASRHAPVIVHAHDFFAACPGGARYLEHAEQFCVDGPGARCIWRAYTERSNNRRPDRIARALTRSLSWRDASFASAFLTASQFVADVLAAWQREGPAMTVVGYPVEPWSGSAVEPAEQPDVLYVGRLVRSKGLPVLLKALADLPGIRLTVAGDGPERSRVEAQAEALGIHDRTTFLGAVDPARREGLFRASKLFVMPSLWEEPFGIVGVEALAAGLPVVASRVGGIPDWLTAGGVLFGRGDSTELARHLDTLLADGGLRSRLAREAPAAARRFSLEAHLDKVLPVVRAVA